MQCPTDGSTLTMSERGGIEIDYCPQCRGVWLDRGELDKIIDRAGQATPVPAITQPIPVLSGGHQLGQQHDSRRRTRRESWLRELFD